MHRHACCFRDPTILIYEYDLQILEDICLHTENELSVGQDFQKVNSITDRQTYCRQTDTQTEATERTATPHVRMVTSDERKTASKHRN